jgi:hypothetical protein
MLADQGQDHLTQLRAAASPREKALINPKPVYHLLNLQGGAFGHVLLGLDVVKKIQQQPVEGQNLVAPVAVRRAWRVGGIR